MEGKERLEQETIEMNNYNVVLIFNYIKIRMSYKKNLTMKKKR